VKTVGEYWEIDQRGWQIKNSLRACPGMPGSVILRTAKNLTWINQAKAKIFSSLASASRPLS
jgi:hypothetical protein